MSSNTNKDTHWEDTPPDSFIGKRKKRRVRKHQFDIMEEPYEHTPLTLDESKQDVLEILHGLNYTIQPDENIPALAQKILSILEQERAALLAIQKLPGTSEEFHPLPQRDIEGILQREQRKLHATLSVSGDTVTNAASNTPREDVHLYPQPLTEKYEQLVIAPDFENQETNREQISPDGWRVKHQRKAS